MLVNVLDNAADFSVPGTTIRITVHSTGNSCVIDIDDEGPGIAAADRQRIFDMFFSSPKGDRQRHGAGLGLTICDSIVRAHGGTISALARPDGPGTRIRIDLPERANPTEKGDA